MSELIEALRSGQTSWVPVVQSLTAVEWRRRPDHDNWSPAECAEHIVIVESRLVKAIKAGVAAGKSEPERAAAIAGKEEMMRKRIPSRSVKVKAPEPMVPSGRIATPAEFLEEFQSVRAQSIELAASNNPLVDTFVMPHFVLGDFTGTHWLWFIALHGDRHLNQIREILASY